MTRRPLLLASALAAILNAGCSTLDRDAREAVLAQLPDRHGASFSDFRQFPGDVLCGRYTATDFSGLRVATHDFIYSGGEVFLRPDPLQRSLFCTDDPAGALYRELGIGPWGENDAALRQLQRDLGTLEAAIRAYIAATGDAPLQDLSVLVPPAGDYLPELPVDPWGALYHYELGLGPRSGRDFLVYSLGADGRQGGTGAAADVGREHLPYLDRLARF